MATKAAAVQIADVERMERELADARKAIAQQLREKRDASGLSLREVAPHVGLSVAAVSLAERGETWQTETAKRLLGFYARHPKPAATAA